MKSKKKQSKKTNQNFISLHRSCVVIAAIIVVFIIGALGCYCWNLKNNSTLSTLEPYISEDKKSIMSGDDVLLSIDDDAIMDFAKTTNMPCWSLYTDSQALCQDKATFKNGTSFDSITLSPNKDMIAFSFEFNSLPNEDAVGMLYLNREADRVEVITKNSLGDTFVSFSPNGKYFVYECNGWEGIWGLLIKDSETLADKLEINNPYQPDMRDNTSIFKRWISNNEIEYVTVQSSVVVGKYDASF